MGSRAAHERAAIEQSAALKDDDLKSRKHGWKEAGSDVDRELGLFFNGGYKADAGLHSGLGNAGTGASGRVPDGWNAAVDFGNRWPEGRLEQGRVEAALRRLSRGHVAALGGYYTKRPAGTFAGLTEAFGEFAGVVLVGAEKVVLAYCAERCRVDLERAERASRAAIVAAEERLRNLRAAEALLETSDAADRHLRLWQVRRKLEAAETPMQRVDTESALRAKWANPGETEALAALRELCSAANAKQYTAETRAARKTKAELLARAKRDWAEARDTYATERRNVDNEIRELVRRQRKNEDREFAASCTYIPADQD